MDKQRTGTQQGREGCSSPVLGSPYPACFSGLSSHNICISWSWSGVSHWKEPRQSRSPHLTSKMGRCCPLLAVWLITTPQSACNSKSISAADQNPSQITKHIQRQHTTFGTDLFIFTPNRPHKLILALIRSYLWRHYFVKVTGLERTLYLKPRTKCNGNLSMFCTAVHQ